MERVQIVGFLGIDLYGGDVDGPNVLFLIGIDVV